MRKILIVDDDMRQLSYLIDELRHTYLFDVTWLSNANKVLELLNEFHYDAIILDIMMKTPEDWPFEEQLKAESGLSTGLVLHEKIRTMFPLIPIVIYSAKSVSTEDKYTDVVRKPALNSEIVERINFLIRNEN